MSAFWLVLGTALGLVSCIIFFRLKIGNLQVLSKEIIEKAQQDADKEQAILTLALREKNFEHQRKLDHQSYEAKLKISKEEERLKAKEEILESHLLKLERKLAEIEKKEIQIVTKTNRLEETKKAISLLEKKVISELESISFMSTTQAKELLLQKVETQVTQDMARLTIRLKEETEENADKEASRIIAAAIQRLAIPCSSEILVATVSLPSEEMKGRIIGREGRNIRVLEHLTGVTFLVDETPDAVVISCYDPIRKQIAKTALSELIQDGRIHPTRIEEAVIKAQEQITKKIKEVGTDAALRAGVLHLHPEILILLGKLSFRSSLGQNALEHSLEVSYIMNFMAAELGLDPMLAKRIGLLHDMGKAVSHELEGSHAIIGYELALKYGENEAVANGIGCHHNEIPPQTLEGSLCSAADAISGGRPGARTEAVEQYIKRLRKLEAISHQFEGVIKAYALQAGREIRVLVEPDQIDDKAAINLARQLAGKIEQELSYPGKIKVTVIREKRATEYAT